MMSGCGFSGKIVFLQGSSYCRGLVYDSKRDAGHVLEVFGMRRSTVSQDAYCGASLEVCTSYTPYNSQGYSGDVRSVFGFSTDRTCLYRKVLWFAPSCLIRTEAEVFRGRLLLCVLCWVIFDHSPRKHWLEVKPTWAIQALYHVAKIANCNQTCLAKRHIYEKACIRMLAYVSYLLWL